MHTDTKDINIPAINLNSIHISERDWEEIFNSITDMITIHDNDFNIIYVNHAAKKNLKISSINRRKAKCFKYYHGTTSPPEGCPSCKCLKTGTSETFEIFEPYLNKFIEIKAIPRFDNNNIIVGVIHIVRDLTKQKQEHKKSLETEKKLQVLSSHLLFAREEEREHLAREIHDELAQSLTALRMDLTLMQKNLSIDQTEPHRSIKSMLNNLDTTIHSVQRVSAAVRTKPLDTMNLNGAITWQTRRFQYQTGISCKVSTNISCYNIDNNISMALLRILQESLTNIYRHAKATTVQVKLLQNAGHLIMEVKDNGSGITAEHINSPNSLGLIGMRERVNYLGGKIDIANFRNNKRTRISVDIPLGKRAGHFLTSQ